MLYSCIITIKQQQYIPKMEGRRSKRRQMPSLRFLIATDVHLGHAQNHQQLGNDSYFAFEQVLETAKREDVDFVLLGGDLFDEVNPTQKCIFKCLNLLRDNIFGNRELEFGVKGITPNFSSQNLNIALPIFTIHGNHDYPSNDFGKISVCDLLHASNYVNYFGKNLTLLNQANKQIVIKPLIFQKNKLATRLAIYGVGYIKDHKLHKLLQDKALIFEKPEKEEQTVCILIIHQNRFKGKKGGVGASYENCVHPEQLPKWMDLVIWCHEHEAIYRVQTEADVNIFQPGSTVITSYIEAESFKKQCGLVSVMGPKKFQLESIMLQRSFRPMITRAYSLQEITQKFPNIENFNFDEYFDNQIAKILAQNQFKKRPIIRIKIDYTNHSIIRLIRVEQKYREKVANSNKIFTYSQKRQPKKTFNLEDNDVLDMIKNNKVPKNVGRETELTQEIMEIFNEEICKTKLEFFDVGQLKDTIIQLANNDGRANLNDIKQMYFTLMEKKCGDLRKDIKNYHNANQKEFKRLYQKLLQNSNDIMAGKGQKLNIDDIKADIARTRSTYPQKQTAILSVLGSVHQKARPGQTQLTSKSTRKTQASKQGQKRKSSLAKSNGDSQGEGNRSLRMSNSSDEDDCCRRAEKDEYRQNDTRTKFQQAEQMVENRDRKKGKGKQKKSVKFEQR